MTPDIALTLFILATAVVLLITEWIPMEVVALLVLGALAVFGLVTPPQGLGGGSSDAVRSVRSCWRWSKTIAKRSRKVYPVVRRL